MNNGNVDEPSAFKKTPLFQAFNSPRYQRQDIIKKVNKIQGTKLICYVASINASIDRDDPTALADLLYNIPIDSDVDLLLHTPGGDIDAADKLMTMLRRKIGTGHLRFIVPDYAKSAGTLMALGADVIIMSDTSELGPIDPQIVHVDKDGNPTAHSVQDFLDAYTQLEEALRKNPNDMTAIIQMQKIDPATIVHYRSVLVRARQIAEQQLKEGMFREKGNWSQAVSLLINTKEWPSHAQPISWQAAANKVGLNIQYLSPDDDAWSMYWQLYCHQKLALGAQGGKLFESDYASLNIT